MAKVCPKCSADNSDEARFCDQCAAPLSPEAVADVAAQGAASAPVQRSAPAVNWTALIIVLVIIAAVVWLFRPPAVPKPGAMPEASTAAGGAGGVDNPHAQAGGGNMGGDVMKQLADAKAALEKDPLATESLITLYQMYGMIGREKEVRPYMDKAYAALVGKRKELGQEAPKMLAQIVTAAMMGNDAEAAIGVLEKYQQLDPQDTSTSRMLGDVNFDIANSDEAIKWYTLYLSQAKPEVEGDTYWRVRIDRATMYLSHNQPVDGKDPVQLAVSELESITQQVPAQWNGWFNLGVAYNTAKQPEKARAAWNKASTLASGEYEKWQVAAELAKLDGKEPPPQPANPHGMMGGAGGMGGGANPHGGMDMGGAGGANPHSGMDMGGAGGGMENPHGGASGGA
jgi:hypothetical protein